jgi:hypothetical protein
VGLLAALPLAVYAPSKQLAEDRKANFIFVLLIFNRSIWTDAESN